MARIPEAEFERLKAEVLVQRLAEALGIELQRHGPDLIGLCPFHEDHRLSLVITLAKNLWHCPGACETGGSVIDWVMKSRGVSFRHAVELLRADHPSLAAPRKIVRKATTESVKLEAPFEKDADDQQVLRLGNELIEMGIDCYRVLFPEGMDANEYGCKVKLTDKTPGVLLMRSRGRRPGHRHQKGVGVH
jgi:hypothetical protein